MNISMVLSKAKESKKCAPPIFSGHSWATWGQLEYKIGQRQMQLRLLRRQAGCFLLALSP